MSFVAYGPNMIATGIKVNKLYILSIGRENTDKPVKNETMLS